MVSTLHACTPLVKIGGPPRGSLSLVTRLFMYVLRARAATQNTGENAECAVPAHRRPQQGVPRQYCDMRTVLVDSGRVGGEWVVGGWWVGPRVWVVGGRKLLHLENSASPSSCERGGRKVRSVGSTPYVEGYRVSTREKESTIYIFIFI